MYDIAEKARVEFIQQLMQREECKDMKPVTIERDARRIDKVIEYWSNPDNELCSWKEACIDVLKVKKASQWIFKAFDERTRNKAMEIALHLRRSKMIEKIAKVEDAMYQKALSGDSGAVKLFKQVVEGWSDKKLGNNVEDVKPENGITQEMQEALDAIYKP